MLHTEKITFRVFNTRKIDFGKYFTNNVYKPAYA